MSTETIFDTWWDIVSCVLSSEFLSYFNFLHFSPDYLLRRLLRRITESSKQMISIIFLSQYFVCRLQLNELNLLKEAKQRKYDKKSSFWIFWNWNLQENYCKKANNMNLIVGRKLNNRSWPPSPIETKLKRKYINRLHSQSKARSDLSIM